ncbi:hypothetical protein GCM10008107_22880 [Psychrosphaera saromensis]|uniref:PKD domain-containing protein n=1 Tax=Psychrosphaera saromensis TaxID=716813 RepID=A0A2S7US78_9GAMM|nr:BspA family leucine-rich repeat surface protein [Psychrosphaera saromensis]PQJ52332.1 hypothetical protein BTO11_00770 [Psychrosphaera saromensis]GHB72891.1 hypothetical protein GCM10008107_22880 [Psychrosphaera saromensis]GLQ13509.1 hypothetical protein GCM10007917_09640 [Psychrosphaera saromensis]
MSLSSLTVFNFGYLGLSNIIRNCSRLLVAISFALTLAACGGGGGDSGEEVIIEVPVDDATDAGSEVAVDTTAPIITLNGDAEVNAEFGSTYTDLGATATDDVDVVVDVITTGVDVIDTSSFSTYTITYTATDAANNTTTKTRTVTVVDTTPPVITLADDEDFNLVQNNRYSKYSESGATAFDLADGDINVVITGDVDHSAIGTYTITYTATDNSNNITTLSRSVNVEEQTPFITVWDTNPAGTNFSSASNQIIIGTDGSGYNFTVDWGDGIIEENLTGDTTHTYSAEGEYTVKITGEFPGIYFGYHTRGYDNDKLLSVEQWGNNPWQSMENAFNETNQMTFNATDAPDLSQVTRMNNMFYDCLAFNSDISHWDVSNVTNMSAMFEETNSFNQDITAWDVSSVTNMSRMFKYADAFNQDISAWDVSSVTNMSEMFANTEIFNQSLNDWDVLNVTDMHDMFSVAEAFNQDISQWDVSNVTTMDRMFYKAEVFNQDISQWDTSSLVNASNMFNGATAFDQNLGEWDMSNVTNVTNMLSSSGLSTVNYDALLNGWSTQILKPNLNFSTNATVSSAGLDAWQYIENTYNWVFNHNSPF